MLPSLLTTDLCSLVEAKDRYTFSSFYYFEPIDVVDAATGEKTTSYRILEEKTEFFKAVIRSSAALSYEIAQNIIDIGREAETAEQQGHGQGDAYDMDKKLRDRLKTFEIFGKTKH